MWRLAAALFNLLNIANFIHPSGIQAGQDLFGILFIPAIIICLYRLETFAAFGCLKLLRRFNLLAVWGMHGLVLSCAAFYASGMHQFLPLETARIGIALTGFPYFSILAYVSFVALRNPGEAAATYKLTLKIKKAAS
jgi:hypothetical protein